MGRLIDADAFKTQVSTMAVKFGWNTNKALSFLKIIDSQPTAYDVDKVVEQLVTESLCVNVDDEPFVMLDTAIEIVKGAANHE